MAAERDDDQEGMPQGDLARESFLRRLRALLHTQPLHQLELHKGMRGGGPDKYEPYDLLALQLAAIDYIADHQNPLRGVPLEEVQQEVGHLAGAMAPKRRAGEHREVATLVLSALENEGAGAFTLSFRDPYGPGHPRQSDVKLVTPDQAVDGSIELRATPQAINLLLDVMDVDIESAERAAAYVLRLQVERGRLRSAAESAERMRRLSKAYQGSIQQAILTAQRDIGQVDWAGRVMAEIERAYGHVDERLREEAAIIEDVAERHAAAAEPGQRQALLQIKELLEDCNRYHRELHTLLMDARTRLLEQHASQRLAPPPSPALVAMHADVLLPVLGLAVAPADDVLTPFAAGTVPPLPPALVSVSRVADHLWRARAERQVALRPVVPVELDDEDEAQPRFTPEAVAFARELLGRDHRGTPLSRLLSEASAPGSPPGAARLVALGGLEAFMDAGGEVAWGDEAETWRLVPRGLTAERTGGRLDHPDYAGDELALTRAEP
ncbi:MAG: hypothetical protein E6J41_20215 [Chloroflexi bacterium]|nr:MAG: hypothetical protein E6J41_20215 [Chloroflexota bacterium]